MLPILKLGLFMKLKDKAVEFLENGFIWMVATSCITVCFTISLVWGHVQYQRGYKVAETEVEDKWKKREQQKQEEFDRISTEVTDLTKSYLEEHQQKVRVEKVFIDRIVEKPVYINQCIDQAGVDRLNSRRGVK